MEQLNLADEKRAIEYFKDGIKTLAEAEKSFNKAAKLTVRHNALALYYAKEIGKKQIEMLLKVSEIEKEEDE